MEKYSNCGILVWFFVFFFDYRKKLYNICKFDKKPDQNTRIIIIIIIIIILIVLY